MNYHYSAEKHTQYLISLMKFHGVKKIIASPGTTDICFVGSLQSDPYFEIYSSVDERSAAFIACGMAAESEEPVAIVCTGSTASRNYIPGLTEAYYRKLPVLAITTTQHLGRIGNYCPQVIDRSQQLKDIVNCSVTVDCVYTSKDEWACQLDINKALIALKKNGGGPAHINLVTTYSDDFSVNKLPEVKGVLHFENPHNLPSIAPFHHIAILVGVHNKWSVELTDAVEKFCEKYNAVVYYNHASNYKGKHGVNIGLFLGMSMYKSPISKADLTIYIGSVARYGFSGGKEFWRVNPDGEIRDPKENLTKVIQIDETEFFSYYVQKMSDIVEQPKESYAKQWQHEYKRLIEKMPELPFSNVWIAKNMIQEVPPKSVLHLAGSNTARSWNFFEMLHSVDVYSNDGTMGIDGQVSAFIGEALSNKNRLHFGVAGDLTFFYDMNVLGNRHIGSNVRLMIINNGGGAEFKLYCNPAHPFDKDADKYMAALGHYGNKSAQLIKHYAQDLGYEYLTASTKEEFLKAEQRFLTSEMTDRPMVFEVFTKLEDENEAIYLMNHIDFTTEAALKSAIKETIKSIAGEKGVNAIRRIIKK